MNRKKRQSLQQAVESLNAASLIIEIISEEEQDSLDNIPENLETGALYERMEDVVNCLEQATEMIEEAKEMLSEAMS